MRNDATEDNSNDQQGLLEEILEHFCLVKFQDPTMPDASLPLQLTTQDWRMKLKYLYFARNILMLSQVSRLEEGGRDTVIIRLTTG